MTPAVRLLACAAMGFAYGYATSYVSSPQDPRAFWISNLAAPWLVLAFVAGALQSRVAGAAAAGVLADVACVAGFYRLPDAFFPTWYEEGVDRNTGTPSLIRTSLSRWFDVNVYWLGVAIVAGAAFGACGYVWRRHHKAGVALGVAIALEPAYWRWTDGGWPTPVWIWPLELAAGAAVGVLLTRIRPIRSHA